MRIVVKGLDYKNRARGGERYGSLVEKKTPSRTAVPFSKPRKDRSFLRDGEQKEPGGAGTIRRNCQGGGGEGT